MRSTFESGASQLRRGYGLVRSLKLWIVARFASRVRPSSGDANLDELHLEVALAVLDVADQLTSPELARRLGAALQPLSGVTVVAPAVGDALDPKRHIWEASEPAPDRGAIDRVSQVRSPGLVSVTGEIHRKARVVVSTSSHST